MGVDLLEQLTVHAPVRKSKYYYCKVADPSQRLVKLKIPYCVLQQVWLLSKQQGYMLHVRVPKDDFAKEVIEGLEERCIQEIIKKNSQWFKNELGEEKIRELFESSISGETIILYVSALRSYFSGEDTPICNWLENHKHAPKNIRCTIVCDGLFIYPRKFGMRWVIRELGEYKEDPEEILPDVPEILEHWKERSAKYLLQLDEKQRAMEKKVATIQERRRQVLSQMEKIKSVEIYQLEEEVEALRGLMEEDDRTFP